MSNPNKSETKRPRLRTVLLGATAALVIGGVATHGHLGVYHAHAQNMTQAMQNHGAPSFADVVERVRGAVVSVKVNVVESADASADENHDRGTPRLAPGDPLERFFRRFGENGMPGMNGGRPPGPRMGQAQGSGFIISPDGYVVTNNHVVENASGDVSLKLDDGRSVSASVVGTDPKTDLALLKIKDAGTYKSVSFSSAAPRVGDWVIAVGNPFGLGGTVTAGIVSARGRDIGSGPYDDFLQIDAPVNRGNSGGPTFNANGEVVGVNTAIYSPSGGSVGIGFAIPSEVARDVIASLKDKGAVARGWIGVQIQPVTEEIADSMGLRSTKGALVAETQPNSPAQAAGLKSGDVITGVNGDKIESPRELSRRIASMGPETKVQLTYLHDGAEKTASLKLGALPGDKQAKAQAAPAEREAPLEKFGLTLAPSRNGEAGVVVAGVDPDGAAAAKGLRTGDVILEAAGQPVTSPVDVQKALASARKEGRKAVLLRVKSGDNARFVALAAQPAT